MLAPTMLFGQTKSLPIIISAFNEATAVPFTRFFTTPIHSGIQVGTEFNYKEKEHGRLFQTANLSYYYHTYLSQGIGITTELGYEYRLSFGLAFEGFMHRTVIMEKLTNIFRQKQLWSCNEIK